MSIWTFNLCRKVYKYLHPLGDVDVLQCIFSISDLHTLNLNEQLELCQRPVFNYVSLPLGVNLVPRVELWFQGERLFLCTLTLF
jgi:hypothetical protein